LDKKSGCVKATTLVFQRGLVLFFVSTPDDSGDHFEWLFGIKTWQAVETDHPNK
jgi:hypothetical protein